MITGTGKFYQKFGAVEVGPFTFYEMLKRNETILLFPGGANEALHAKGEDYVLKWPEKVDFVRMAGTYYECCVVASTFHCDIFIVLPLDINLHCVSPSSLNFKFPLYLSIIVDDRYF